MASSISSQISNVTVREVFNSTVELTGKCEGAYHQLDRMLPKQQVDCVNAIALSTISEQLKTIKKFIASIQFNQKYAVPILYLCDSTNKILKKQCYNPDKLKELQSIAVELMLVSKQKMNESNKRALQSIKETLDDIEKATLDTIEEQSTPSDEEGIISSTESEKKSESDSNSDIDSNRPKSISQEIENPIDGPKQAKAFDPDDPFLVVQEITNLIMQMQASSLLSSEDKEKTTKGILALLSESPAIEPAPSHPPVNPSPIIHRVEKKVDALQELQNLLLLSQHSFAQDCKNHLLALESKRFKLPIMGDPSVDVVGRIYFHLYFIHKSPNNRLPKDPNYGRNAMMGVYSTTHDERIRAVMRTIAEVALQKLEDAVNLNQFEEIHAALVTLEGLKMSPSDMPPEKNNLAHTLFSEMYNKHVEMRKSKTWLIDPRDWKFRRDFGRKAFSMSEGIDAVDKIAVIKNLLQALKRVWQIP